MVLPAHGTLFPAIFPGVGGGVVVGERPKVLAALDPQPFTATTEIGPEVAPAVTVIEGVPWPEVIVQPEGTVQV